MSRPPRFFIDPSQISGSTIVVTGGDLRHIRTVLRKQPGDLLTLLDGRGGEYAVRIRELGKDAVVTAVLDRREREVKGPAVILGQGIAKADKMDWVVQKATELGVSSIVPLITERTIVKVKDEEKRVSRWLKICREAAMQCGRPDIPAVGRIVPFNDFLQAVNAELPALLLLPWEEGTVSLKQVLRAHPAPRKIVVLIGPEGGFSRDEAGRAAGKGFQAVSLGPSILRTETAALAVLSMIGYEQVL
jgi:16S rRNA (uracil1498-N3)-methyltransferase